MELVLEYRAEESRHGCVCTTEGSRLIIINDDEIKLGPVLKEGLLVSGGYDLGGFNLERVDAGKRDQCITSKGEGKGLTFLSARR